MPLAVGQHLRRRSPLSDDWDEVVVRGFSEGGEVVEPVVSGVVFTESLAVDPSILLKHYTLVASNDPSAEIEAGLAKLWETEPSEVTSG